MKKCLELAMGILASKLRPKKINCLFPVMVLKK